jgi:hypothetical protein
MPVPDSFLSATKNIQDPFVDARGSVCFAVEQEGKVQILCGGMSFHRVLMLADGARAHSGKTFEAWSGTWIG